MSSWLITAATTDATMTAAVRIVLAGGKNGELCVAGSGVMDVGTDAATASAFGSGVKYPHRMSPASAVFFVCQSAKRPDEKKANGSGNILE